MTDIRSFQETVWNYYHGHGRDLPWRAEGVGAYRVLVSEIMLQQTQAARVIPKYHDFLEEFPTIHALAEAHLAAVLKSWSGLGYNRRARYLHEAAKQLVDKPEPWSIEDLEECKGIGFNTAAAVVTYAYNQAIPFIETNIRTVFIHHFFADGDKVPDADLLPLVEQALDREHPREWGWALMDYGVHIKATVGNASRSSKHYAKQTKFEGSKRQVRGQVLRLLMAGPKPYQDVRAEITDQRLESVLRDLLAEQLITETKDGISLG